MRTSLRNKLTKFGTLFLGLAMGLGVAVGVTSGNKASEVNAGVTEKVTTMTWSGTTNKFTFSDSGDTYLEWSYSGGSASNNPIQEDDFRMYAGVSFTLSAKSLYTDKVTIKSLAITGKSSKKNNSLFYNASTGAVVTSGSELSWGTSSSTKTATFNDGLNSVSVSRISSGNQVRVTKIVVTYYLNEGSAKTLDSIDVTTENNRSFFTGDTFIKETITATYSNGDTADVTNSASFSGYNMSNIGTQTVSVSYTEGEVTKETSYTITVSVPATLVSLAVSGSPTKTSYNNGDSFDTTGLVVTGTYDDTSTKTITEDITWTITPETLCTGQTSVSVVATVSGISSSAFTVNGLTVAAAYVYEKVTSNLDDWSGHYLIVNGSKAWDAHSTFNANGTYVNVSDSGGKITLTHQNYEWEFSPVESDNNKYSIKSQTKDSNNNYYYLNQGNSSGGVASSTSPVGMTVEYSSNSVSIKASSFYLRYNSNYFRFYSSSTQGNAISLYKLREAAKYKITYVLNGGEGETPTQESLVEGAKFNLPAAPSRIGYSFNGWSDGTQTYDADYEYTVGTSALTFTAQWTALEITSISVNTAPTTVLYTTGEKFDPTGLVLNVVFSNNTSTTVSYASESSNFSFDPNLNTELGTDNESVSITYGGQTCSQSITVEDPKTVTSIVFSGQTTDFKIGSTFAGPTTVTAKYNHGQDEDVINEVTITGYDMNTAGTQTVTVSYTEDGTTVSDTYTIHVITISSFTVTGTVSGNVGGSWDTSNVVVKANWESVFEQETLTSDYTLTLDPATPTKGTTSVMVDVNYKSGLVSMTDVAELDATVINIKYDTLVWSDTNVTSYTEWNSIVKTTGVKYNGNTTKNTKDGHDQIQLRSSSKSGIWTSDWSEGKDGNIKSASLVWGPSTTTTRTLEFYGRNTAYSGTEMPTSDPGLDNPGNRDLGTYLGCIIWGNDSSGNPNPTSVSFTGSYKYVCAVGLGGAMYLDSITFGWGDADSLSSFSISGQKNSFELGDKFSLGDSYTATATYTESGNKGVTSGFTYQMGESLDSLEDITENYDITLEDNNKYVVVTYTDPNDNSQQRSATAYQISVDYAKATSIALTTAHGKIYDDPLVIAVGKTSDPITATIEPLNLVKEGILIDDEGLTFVQVNNDDTLTGLSVGDEQVTVYSADMEVSTTLYVSVTLAPGMDVSDETLEGGSGGTGMLSVEPFNIPEGKTPSYVWTVEDDNPQGCVTVTEDEEDDSNAIVSYIAAGTATIKVEGYLNGSVFDTKYCEVAVTQSSVTKFEINNANGTNGTIYTGNYDNTASFISEVNTTGIATKSVNWYTSNDSVKLNGEVHKSNNPLVTDGNTQVDAVYNSSRVSTTDTVTLTATSAYDPAKSVNKTITIKNESVTGLSWTGGANIECFAGTTKLDTSDWSFAAAFASGDSSTPTLGSGADDVHVYIVEDSEISEEPTTLTPVSNEQELTANDNGYLVAFYKGYKCESIFSVTVVGKLNNVIATYLTEDHGTKTSNAITSKVFDADNLTKKLNDLTLELENNGGYYGSDSSKGQQIGSGGSPASSMTLSTSSVNGTISKVTINTSGAKDINASVSVSVGGVPFTCDGIESKSITADATPYEFTGSSSGEVVISWANLSSKAMYFKQIDIEYNNDSTDSPDIANTNLNAQKAVLDFIKDANGYLIKGCENGDGISEDNWYLVAKLYKDYFVEQNPENSDVFVANEADRKLAIDLLYYGVGGVWTSADSNWEDSGIDDLQRFLKTYDTGVLRYKMPNFIKDSTGTATRSIKPISNNISLFGENSILGESSSTTWIITIIAIAGIAAAGGYFYSRKRKEN